MFRPALPSQLRRLAARGSVAVVLATGLLVGAGPASHAADPLLACTGGGQVTITHQADGTYHWTLSGIGSCSQAKLAQPRQVTLVGTATTTSLGICSGDAVIAPFAMAVTATFVSLSPSRESVTTTQHQSWSIPASTFPVVSEFGIVDEAGGALGVGELATRIFGQCPPEGTPNMQVNWVQSG
jgi:hypothetical protein